jgi:hypothetical protein
MNIAKQHCNGKRWCKLRASPKIFGNPCHGTSTCLKVTFSCVRKYNTLHSYFTGRIVLYFIFLLQSVSSFKQYLSKFVYFPPN